MKILINILTLCIAIHNCGWSMEDDDDIVENNIQDQLNESAAPANFNNNQIIYNNNQNKINLHGYPVDSITKININTDDTILSQFITQMRNSKSRDNEKIEKLDVPNCVEKWIKVLEKIFLRLPNRNLDILFTGHRYVDEYMQNLSEYELFKLRNFAELLNSYKNNKRFKTSEMIESDIASKATELLQANFHYFRYYITVNDWNDTSSGSNDVFRAAWHVLLEVTKWLGLETLHTKLKHLISDILIHIDIAIDNDMSDIMLKAVREIPWKYNR